MGYLIGNFDDDHEVKIVQSRDNFSRTKSYCGDYKSDAKMVQSDPDEVSLTSSYVSDD